MSPASVFWVYVAIIEDDGEVFTTQVFPVRGLYHRPSDLDVDVLVAIGRGLLYAAGRVRVKHAVFTREDGNSWELVGSFGQDGEADEDVASDLYELTMGQGPAVPT